MRRYSAPSPIPVFQSATPQILSALFGERTRQTFTMAFVMRSVRDATICNLNRLKSLPRGSYPIITMPHNRLRFQIDGAIRTGLANMRPTDG